MANGTTRFDRGPQHMTGLFSVGTQVHPVPVSAGTGGSHLSLPRGILSIRACVLGTTAAIYVATVILSVSALIGPQRLSLTLRTTAGETRIAWLLPGGNLWDVGMRPGNRVLVLDGHAPAGAAGSWSGQQLAVRLSNGRLLSAGATTAVHTADSWPLLVLSPCFLVLGVLLHVRARPSAVAVAACGLSFMAAFLLALGPAVASNRFIAAVAVERAARPLFAGCFLAFFLVFAGGPAASAARWPVVVPAMAVGVLNIAGTIPWPRGAGAIAIPASRCGACVGCCHTRR